MITPAAHAYSTCDKNAVQRPGSVIEPFIMMCWLVYRSLDELPWQPPY